MRIVCLKRVIVLEAEDSLKLELKFNLTDKGKEWKHIGDFLYNNKDISVNMDQFKFLTDLLDKNNISYIKTWK